MGPRKANPYSKKTVQFETGASQSTFQVRPLDSSGPSLQPQAGPSSQRQGGPSSQRQAGPSLQPQGRPSSQRQAGPSSQPQAESFLQSQHPHNARQRSQTPRNMITEPRGCPPPNKTDKEEQAR